MGRAPLNGTARGPPRAVTELKTLTFLDLARIFMLTVVVRCCVTGGDCRVLCRCSRFSILLGLWMAVGALCVATPAQGRDTRRVAIIVDPPPPASQRDTPGHALLMDVLDLTLTGLAARAAHEDIELAITTAADMASGRLRGSRDPALWFERIDEWQRTGGEWFTADAFVAAASFVDGGDEPGRHSDGLLYIGHGRFTHPTRDERGALLDDAAFRKGFADRQAALDAHLATQRPWIFHLSALAPEWLPHCQAQPRSSDARRRCRQISGRHDAREAVASWLGRILESQGYRVEAPANRFWVSELASELLVWGLADPTSALVLPPGPSPSESVPGVPTPRRVVIKRFPKPTPGTWRLAADAKLLASMALPKLRFDHCDWRGQQAGPLSFRLPGLDPTHLSSLASLRLEYRQGSQVERLQAPLEATRSGIVGRAAIPSHLVGRFYVHADVELGRGRRLNRVILGGQDCVIRGERVIDAELLAPREVSSWFGRPDVEISIRFRDAAGQGLLDPAEIIGLGPPSVRVDGLAYGGPLATRDKQIVVQLSNLDNGTHTVELVRLHNRSIELTAQTTAVKIDASSAGWWILIGLLVLVGTGGLAFGFRRRIDPLTGTLFVVDAFSESVFTTVDFAGAETDHLEQSIDPLPCERGSLVAVSVRRTREGLLDIDLTFQGGGGREIVPLGQLAPGAERVIDALRLRYEE